MQNEILTRMIDYHYWAQSKLWECIAPLTDEQLQHDPNYSRGSVLSQLRHMYVVEWMWYRIISDDLPKARAGWPQAEAFTTPALIRAAWDELEAQLRIFVARASDVQLSRIVEQSLMNPPRTSTTWEAIIYIVTHAADHRSQILQLIHNQGGKTVMQDFIRYVWGLDDPPT